MMMLWDLMPQTIIEIGSASGGSAAWLADLMACYGLDCHVYSLDLLKPELVHPKVTFLQGDSNNIEEFAPARSSRKRPSSMAIRRRCACQRRERAGVGSHICAGRRLFRRRGHDQRHQGG